MRARALFSLVGALVVAVALVSASAAATTKAQRTTKINVSTRAAVVHYLRSIHVNPKGAVIQRGALNYAGKRCPGSRWTCASTRHAVVQIAKRGGQNRFVCRSSKCVVVQFSGVSRGVYISGRTLASTTATTASKGNSATCIKTGSGATTGSGQSCLITQTSGPGPNKAVVYENTMKVSGLSQSAQYTAVITQQSSGSNDNTACVTQNISLDGSATNTNGKQTTANLQAHQSVTIRQNATGSGTNNAAQSSDSSGNCTGSTITQSQTLTSTINATGPITQNEDATFSPCGDSGLLPIGQTDYANLCLDIEQNQGSSAKGIATGPNFAKFTQNSTQTAIANTSKGPVIQTQSTPLCSTQANPTIAPSDCAFPGGLVGTINQDSRAASTANATQNETQCEDAAKTGLTTCHTGSGDQDFNGSYTLTQNQYGPVGVGKIRNNHAGRRRVGFSHGKGLGASIQTGGNSGNNFHIFQTSTQDNDHGTGSTQQNTGQADCISTNGSCTAAQTTTVNGAGTQDGYTSPTISQLTINCPKNHACIPTPPPTPVITNEPPAQNLSSSGVFEWTDDATGGITFECNVDSAGFTSTNCSSGNSFTNTYGDHSFQVRAVDNFGNRSAPTTEYDWTNVPPTPTIDTGPQGTSNSPEASFTFSDSDLSLSFQCSIDGGTTYHPCSSPQKIVGLADGSHTFSVKATDGAGHFSAAASQTWTVQVFTWTGTQLTATNVDIGEFGVGGMRGSGTGSIGVSGVSGTVLRAYLYWNGPTNSTDLNSNANVTFDGNPVAGTNIGTASDNNWGFLNGQSYRADVTSLVSGNGAYTLSDFKNVNADINGVSLIVFYDDGSTANDRNIVLWNGNDSNVTPGPSYAPDGWDETLTNVPYPGSGSASLDLVVSDGQSVFADDALVVNGTTVAPAGAIFSGDSVPPNQAGGLWDIKSFDITSLLPGSNNSLEITTGVNADYLSLVVAIANTPAS